jgi:GNAT superfamily N-acetyltransferase
MRYQVTTIEDPETLHRIFRLRALVWSEVMGIASTCFAGGMWRDSFDDSALHWAAFRDGAVVGAARLSVHESIGDCPDAEIFTGSSSFHPPIACLTRLVVHPSARGAGIAASLDDARLAEAERLHCRTVTVFVHHLSGPRRLQALLARGFQCLAPIDSWPDPLWGGFGTPVAKLLNSSR